MTEKLKTPLTISIERKRERIFVLTERLESNPEELKATNNVLSFVINELENQIAEDEKLLQYEKEQIIRNFDARITLTWTDRSMTAEEYFTNTYQQ